MIQAATTGARTLIVNADDFGQSPGINRGVIQAHQNGIVTSASLMVRFDAAVPAAKYALEHPKLSVGLHIDLGEKNFVHHEWVSLYEVVEKEDAVAVEREIADQIRKFKQLMGRGPTHLDSHQHVHQLEPVRSLMRAAAGELGVPLRGFSEVHYRGNFYGQSAEGYPCHEYISVKGLTEILASLERGTTELGCHPASEVDLITMYADERLLELDTLCDAEVRAVIEANQICLSPHRPSERSKSEIAV